MRHDYGQTIPGDYDHCERCGERLKEDRKAWLELNNRTGIYAECGTVPPAESQGCFPFGSACARAVLANGGVLVRTKGAQRVHS
jgi:hypothetical protein